MSKKSSKRSLKKRMKRKFQIESNRPCGTCQACCYVMEVSEIVKPEYAQCPHAGERGEPGCTIYQRRPQGCRTFRCGWTMGAFAREDRPDKLGIVLVQGSGWNDDGLGEIGCIQVQEVWPGASKQERAQELLNHIVTQRGLVVVMCMPDGKRQLKGPIEFVERIRNYAEGAMHAAHDALTTGG